MAHTGQPSDQHPPLRIAFDATALLGVRTGIGTVVAEVLARLATDPTVDIVAYGLTRSFLGDLARLLPAGIGRIRYPIPERTTERIWNRFRWPPIEWWTGRVDVVHGTNWVVPPARRAVELVTVQDLTPIRFPEFCDENTLRFPGLLHRALDRGAHVQTPSRFVADEVVDVLGVPIDRVHVVHNGVTPIRGGDPDRGRRLAGGNPYVLAVGTIEPRKNLAALVAAFDVVGSIDPDLRLVLAGGAGWGMEAFERALAAGAHGGRVVGLGRVDDATRADLMAGAVALAYPSIYEGFGLPPLEAMTAGVPVVAAAAGSLPEVLGDAALLVSPEPDAIADGLGRVLTDDTTRDELVRRGRARASLYSWDRCAAELASLYHRLAGQDSTSITCDQRP